MTIRCANPVVVRAQPLSVEPERRGAAYLSLLIVVAGL
jgi:hypothetical protein